MSKKLFTLLLLVAAGSSLYGSGPDSSSDSDVPAAAAAAAETSGGVPATTVEADASAGDAGHQAEAPKRCACVRDACAATGRCLMSTGNGLVDGVKVVLWPISKPECMANCSTGRGKGAKAWEQNHKLALWGHRVVLVAGTIYVAKKIYDKVQARRAAKRNREFAAA